MFQRPNSSVLLLLGILVGIGLTFLGGQGLIGLDQREAPESSEPVAETASRGSLSAAGELLAEIPLLDPDGGSEELPPMNTVSILAEPPGPAPTPPGAEIERVRVAEPESEPAYAGPLVHGLLAFEHELPADELIQLVARELGDGNEPGRELARVRVASDGVFRLELPPDRPRVWIDLDARYHFLDVPLLAPVELAYLDPAPLLLRPQLGSWVLGRVALPRSSPGGTANAPAPEDPGARRDPPDSGTSPAHGWVELRADYEAAEGATAFGPFDGRTTRRAELDAGGGFELRGVPAGRPFRLGGWRADHVPGEVQLLRTEAGTRHELSLQVTGGARIAGRVQAADGLPSSGMRVVLEEIGLTQRRDRFAPETRVTQTDSDGRFTLRGLLPGSYALHVEGRGASAPTRTNVVLGPEDTQRTLELFAARGQELSGRVRWADGAPAAGQEILAQSGGRDGETRSVTSDDEGRFRLDGLGAEAWSLRVEATRTTSFGDLERSSLNERVSAPSRDLDLVLAPRLPLRGRIGSEDRRPISAFELIADPLALEQGIGFVLPLENKDGTFRVEAFTRGTWELRVRANGYLESEPMQVEIPSADPEPLLFMLRPEQPALGRVLGPDGAGVAGAEIVWTDDAIDAARRRSVYLRADARGDFELRAPPGSGTIWTRAPGFAASVPRPLAASGAPLELSLSHGGHLAGQLLSSTGEGIAGRWIRARAEHPPQLRGVATDADGVFRFENLTPAAWEVWTTPWDGSASNSGAVWSGVLGASAEVLAGEESFVYLGHAPENVAVAGAARLGEAPLVGLLRFLPEGRGSLEGQTLVHTDARGRFQANLPAAGRYLVVAVPGGARSQVSGFSSVLEVGAEGDAGLELAWEASGLSGIVRAPDGTGLGGAELELSARGPLDAATAHGGAYALTRTSADGSFSFPLIPTGDYAVSIEAPPWEDHEGRRWLLGSTVIEDAEARRPGVPARSIEVRLREGGSLSGTLRDLDGSPVPGADVWARAPRGIPFRRFTRVRTDAEGRFSFPVLAPGRWSVLARTATGATVESDPIPVVEGREHQVRLELAPGTLLRVIVQDADGKEQAARFEVFDATGRQVNGLVPSHELGEAWQRGFATHEQRVGPLPEGPYRIVAETLAGQRCEREVELVGQRTRKLILRPSVP